MIWQTEKRKRITSETILSNFSLFAFVAVVKGNDSSRSVVWGRQDGDLMSFNCNVLIVVVSMDLKFLVMVRFIVYVDVVHFVERKNV